MAISSSDAKKMVAAAKKTGRRLFVAQCIRFWPAYAKLREIIQERKYGNVHSAVFTRLSPTPTWTWKNWVLDPRKGGSATLDLHIHDADFILYTFGKPKAVFSRGSGSLRHGFDHVVTSYDYGKGKLISAEGTWDYAPTFKFSMTFRVVMDKATVELGADGQLTVHGNDGSSTVVSVADEDGYTCELRHFIDCLRHGRSSPIVAPQSAMQSIRLVEAEIRSMATGRSVAVRLSSNT
jgi:predicted dehydrogenase